MKIAFWRHDEDPLTKSAKLRTLAVYTLVSAVGLVIFKAIPESLWGSDIQHDASAHIIITVFALYLLWYFIDQNKSWRKPYLVLSLAIVVIVAIQRIFVGAHNEFGVLAGIIIALLAIIFSRWDFFKDKFSF